MSQDLPILPAARIAALGSLPARAREDADMWHRAFTGMSGHVPQELARIAREFAVSERTVRRKHAAWLAAGGDRLALVNGSLVGKAHRRITPEFIEWWKALCESYQRGSKAAYREFVRRWRRGDLIPGLDPDLPRHEVPAGCSANNLYRYAPSPYELAAARRGLGVARAAHGPKVFSTRVGLWAGSHYLFDDLWHDNFVAYSGQAVRVLEFDALDLYSACKFAWGCKPRVEVEGGRMQGLSERQMRMLLAAVLWSHGYSARGTELLVELGTAAIREDMEALLHDRTGGLITVRRGAITGREQAVVAEWLGQGKGNPRHKSPLESLRNLIHNELAALPAQTGLDPEHRPEHTAGLLDYHKALTRAAASLSNDRLSLLRLPLLDYHSQFLPVLDAVYAAINSRVEHDLEGWVEAGHVVLEYRILPDSPDWISPQRLLTLGPEQQALVTQMARTDARCVRQRKLSPHEVWQRGRGDLTKVPAFVVAEILGPDLAKEVPVRGGYFEFQDSEVAPYPLRYEARVREPEGAEYELGADTYCVFANPFNLDELFVHDARGRHLGIARRDTRVSRHDLEAIKARHARVRERERDLLAAQRARNIDRSRANVDMRDHNARVLSGEIQEAADLGDAVDRALRDNY